MAWEETVTSNRKARIRWNCGRTNGHEKTDTGKTGKDINDKSDETGGRVESQEGLTSVQPGLKSEELREGREVRSIIEMMKKDRRWEN